MANRIMLNQTSYHGAGAINEIVNEAKSAGFTKAFVCTDADLVKFGVSAKDDTLPKRLTDVPQDPSRPDTKVPVERMKKTYYKARGWSKDGVPTKAKLRQLKINK